MDDGAEQKLRQKGFAAWLARWFWPGSEKRMLSFYKPDVSTITFKATESEDVVEIPKSSITDKMTIEGYDPKQNNIAKLASNGKININENGRSVGFLQFKPGNERDGGGFRIFLGILVVLDLLSILVLLFLMIRGLL